MTSNGAAVRGASRFLSVCRYTERRPNNSTTTLSWPRPPRKKRQEIGERLRHERERLGYTKQQIAQLLGVPIPAYERFENGDDDPGVYRLPRLAACGFDVMFIITAERHVPVAEENELLSRFRDLSQRGRASIFSTMDALERLAPNLKQEFRRRFKN